MKMYEYSPEMKEEFREVYRESPEELLRIDGNDADGIQEETGEFYRKHLGRSGMEGYAVGMSGGIDSTVTAHLLTESVGPGNVCGAIMPAGHTDERDIEDAAKVAENLGIETNDYESFGERIDGVVDSLEDLGTEDPERQRVKRGNILARCRMIVLRDIAKARDYLVAGTTNASERDLGYFTIAADGKGGVDNEALYNVYKTTERDLAEYLGVDRDIIYKEPTADLWEGQRDRDELNFRYETLDRVLVGLKLDVPEEEIAEIAGDVTLKEVDGIEDQVENTRFKRELAPALSFS